jgi:SH3-like domain-containing protein
MRKYPFLIFNLIFVCMIYSCTQEKIADKILLPPTPIIFSQSNWGLVTARYLRIRERPSEESEMLGPIRQKDVFKIISKTGEPDTVEEQLDYWYQIDYQGLRGWVFGAYIEILNSKEAALERANLLP